MFLSDSLKGRVPALIFEPNSTLLLILVLLENVDLVYLHQINRMVRYYRSLRSLCDVSSGFRGHHVHGDRCALNRLSRFSKYMDMG